MRMLSKENLNDLVKEVFPQVWSLLTNTFSIIFSIAIVFVIMLYFIFILLDYEKIADGWINLIPKKYRHFVKGLSEDVEYSMNRYFRGQSLIALCVGILLAIGFKIIDFPLAILLGLFIGVLNLIPYMQTIGFIPMILLSLIKSTETGQNFWIIFGLSVVVLCIVQCIQDLILTPKIMGKAMGLNPAIILLSLSIWGTLLGFIGLIIALPMTTLCLSYYKRFILMEDEEEKKEQAELMERKTHVGLLYNGFRVVYLLLLHLGSVDFFRAPATTHNGRDAALVRFFPSAGRNHHLYQVEIQMDTKLQHAPRDCFHLHKPFQAGDTQQDADARTTKPMELRVRTYAERLILLAVENIRSKPVLTVRYVIDIQSANRIDHVVRQRYKPFAEEATRAEHVFLTA